MLKEKLEEKTSADAIKLIDLREDPVIWSHDQTGNIITEPPRCLPLREVVLNWEEETELITPSPDALWAAASRHLADTAGLDIDARSELTVAHGYKYVSESERLMLQEAVHLYGSLLYRRTDNNPANWGRPISKFPFHNNERDARDLLEATVAIIAEQNPNRKIYHLIHLGRSLQLLNIKEIQWGAHTIDYTYPHELRWSLLGVVAREVFDLLYEAQIDVGELGNELSYDAITVVASLAELGSLYDPLLERHSREKPSNPRAEEIGAQLREYRSQLDRALHNALSFLRDDDNTDPQIQQLIYHLGKEGKELVSTIAYSPLIGFLLRSGPILRLLRDYHTPAIEEEYEDLDPRMLLLHLRNRWPFRKITPAEIKFHLGNLRILRRKIEQFEQEIPYFLAEARRKFDDYRIASVCSDGQLFEEGIRTAKRRLSPSSHLFR